MLMWYVILGIVIISAGAGLIYLSGRVARFGFMKMFDRNGNNAQYRKTAGFVLILLIFAALSLTVNLVNAVVCLLHFVCIWLLCDLVFYLVGHFRRQPFKYYYAGIAAILLSCAVLGLGWYLNHHVWTTSYTVVSEKAGQKLRIVQFADSHIGTTFGGKGFERHVRKIQELNPDIVLIVGDFVDDGTTREEMVSACRSLGTLKTKYGVYFAFGNHDKGYHAPEVRGFTGNELIAELEKNNIRVLQDKTVLIDNTYYVVGRRDFSEIQRGGFRADMEELVSGLDKNKFIIVMDHQPNDYEKEAKARVDLVLSGHTHGGQLFPLNKVGEWIGANDKTYGIERRGQTNFVVTSGLSDWAIRFKTGTKSELVVIDIMHSDN